MDPMMTQWTPPARDNGLWPLRWSGLLALLLFASPGAQAQVAGDTDGIVHTMTFQKTFSDTVLDPTPLIGDDSRIERTFTYNTLGQPQIPFNTAQLQNTVITGLLEEAGIDVPEWVIDVATGVTSAGVVTFNPYFGLGARIDYGGYFKTTEFGNADITVDYPVQVEIVYPEPNTFGCGHMFTITTNCTIGSNEDMLQVKPPFAEVEIGPILENLSFQAEAGITVDLCNGVLDFFGVCDADDGDDEDDLLSFSESIQLGPSIAIEIPTLPPLLNFCEDAFAPNANMNSLLGCTDPSAASTLLQGAQAILNALNESPDSPYDDLAMAVFSDNLVEVSEPDLPSLPYTTLPEINGEFRRIVADSMVNVALDEGRWLRSFRTMEDIAKLRVDLISLMEYAGPEFTTEWSLGGGIFKIDLGDVAPTFNVDQVHVYDFRPKVHLALDLGVPMAWSVSDPVLGVVSTGNSQVVELLAGQSVICEYPDALSDPTVVSNVYSLDGDFTTLIQNNYSTAVDLQMFEIVLGEELIDPPLEWSIEQTVGETPVVPESPMVMMDNIIELTGFPTFQLANFTLDPEKPIIDVDQLSIEDILNVGGGARQVVYKAVISNGGDVRLHDVLTTLDLGSTFATASNFSVLCLYSKDMEVNAGYDGVSDIQLLAPLNTLEVGQSGTIEILIEVTPEISGIDANGCFGTVDYTASTKAYGVSPIGTAVESNVYHCTGVATAADIIASVDLGASVIDDIADFTVYGTTDVLFRKTSAICQGNVGSSGRIMFENPSLFTGETATIIGDIHAGEELKLIGTYEVIADYIQVGDQLTLNGSTALDQNGAMSYPSECVSVFEVPAASIPVNTSDVQVTADVGSTMDLAPGAYKKVRHLSNSTLRMVSGTYDIDTWAVNGDDARIEFDASSGPVVINIDKWQPANSPGLEMIITNADGSPNDVVYIYPGQTPVNFDGSHVQGTILAPSAAIKFDDGSNLEGRCYAQKVIFSLQSYYTDPSYLEHLNIDPACQPQPRSLELELAQWGGYAEDLGVRVVPNPFQSSTALWLDLGRDGAVSVELFDMLGKRVSYVPTADYAKGRQTIDLGMEDVLPGSYLVRVTMGEQVVTTRLVKTN